MDADRLFEIGEVFGLFRNPVDLPFADRGVDLGDDQIAALLIGDRVDDDPALPLFLDDFGLGADEDAAAAVEIRLLKPLARDDAAGREVGTGADSQQFGTGDRGAVDHGDRRVADFTDIVRRDTGRHPDGDTVGTVDQEVRRLGGENRRLEISLVVGGDVVDRVEFEVFQQRHRHRGEARLGVSHRRGGQTGDRTEVPLFVDQQVAHVPLLGHADQGRVNDRLTVGMVVTAGIAGDLGAFDAVARGAEPQIVHRYQNTPLRRL